MVWVIRDDWELIVEEDETEDNDILIDVPESERQRDENGTRK